MGQEDLIVIVNSCKELKIMGNEYNSDYDLFPLIVEKYHKLLADIDYDGHKLDQESIDNSIHSINIFYTNSGNIF